ncbi:MAG TPA: hypothetical protein VMH80_11255 [Bryobacteraceae bacterium]|nr:hypothetical protein [Bryobacteraceae bacterium]
MATALLFLMASAGLADIVPISLSQDVNGSGGVLVCRYYPAFTCDSGGFDFDASNSQPGPYSVNKTGEAEASGTFPDDSVAETVQVQQSSDETTNSIFVKMSTIDQYLHQGASYLIGLDSELGNDYSFEFNLTSASILHLVGSVSHSNDGFGGEAGGSFGHTGFRLAGPGIELGSPCPLCDAYYPTSFDYTLALNPGVFTLTAFADEKDGESNLFFGDSGAADGELSLNALFTPVVPEPRWVVFPALLLAIGIGGAALRKRKPADL